MAVLDATFLADLDRNSASARLLLGALADEGRPLVVPAPVLLAFLAGAADPARARLEVEARFEVVPFGPEEAARAAEVARGGGAGADWVLLAAAGAALHRAEPLVTSHEKAFRDVPGLDVLTYRR